MRRNKRKILLKASETPSGGWLQVRAREGGEGEEDEPEDEEECFFFFLPLLGRGERRRGDERGPGERERRRGDL
eukprot:290473-Rhodomonas_salina.2